jgi:hypothetical protein
MTKRTKGKGEARPGNQFGPPITFSYTWKTPPSPVGIRQKQRASASSDFGELGRAVEPSSRGKRAAIHIKTLSNALGPVLNEYPREAGTEESSDMMRQTTI